jgi:UDP-glucose:glycoprotein glucosyltransferase
MPFDRTLGAVPSSLPSILYTDITSPSFRKFHKSLSQSAKDGKTTYRIRHKPSTNQPQKELGINGYGIALDLKRTDYIVIDDREAQGEKPAKSSGLENGGGEDGEDLKPLSESQLVNLDVNAASYVTSSSKPLDALLKITQDFPKHSAWLVDNNASTEFLNEHQKNRNFFLPQGFTVMWINGVQVDSRKSDPFSLLDQLRRERKLIANFQNMGLTAPEAIKLLSNPAIAEAQGDQDTQRYDWRDAAEGGDVIIWLNDIEKDKRYQDWPDNLLALLQRGYPGQLPSVRRDIHNAIVPVDFSDPKQVMAVVEPIQDIIKRKIPCRWGLVPVTKTKEAEEQARAAYHIIDTYGLGALMQYLETALSKKKLDKLHQGILDKSISGRKVKKDREALPLQEIVKSEDLGSRLENAGAYLSRLGANKPSPPIFVNGVPIKQDDEWLSTLSQRVSMDLRLIQRAVYEETLAGDTWVAGFFLQNAALRRNPLIIPEDEKEIKLFNLATVYQGQEKLVKEHLPRISVAEESDKELWTQLLVIGDFNTAAGLDLAADAVGFIQEHGNVELAFVNNAVSSEPGAGKSSGLLSMIPFGTSFTEERLAELQKDLKALAESSDIPSGSSESWPQTDTLVQSLGFRPGESGLIISGRRVGPIPANTTFSQVDFETLYDFELKKRIKPAATALKVLDLSAKLKDVYDTATLCSMLAVSTVSDMPEGVFELPPPIRTGMFNDWDTTHTSITVGDNSTAIIQIVATIDPATEIAQRWVPILKVLSELDGVYTRIFLNPKEKLQELPVKRFYRSVLESRPTFNEDGSLRDLSANFVGMPRKTLMTMAMDVPPSWLVASKDSIYDLDNIKLSTVGDDTVVDATYELESILIEGHSRDVSAGMPPRGAQLVLSTAKDPHFADTIIMANLGYFQFKANPGYYNIKMQAGPSEEIFNIDSVGALGYNAHPGDETTDVTMMSFQGVTLFPRLSRKPGKEDEDVLGTGEKKTATDILSQGSKFVDGLLSKAGIKNADTGKYLSAALDFGTSLLGKVEKKTGTDVLRKAGVAPGQKSAHADINIFSVASGHLYERMLNIMMVSVMRHTNHTVKFWFIEQFLSPSFKSFVPTLAKEYGFQYEMVSYKWPHWLRAQKEKQREIWGYKILFLDVLFPLDLDKVIFVDSDQIVRTDMYDLVQHDLEGKAYGFTPMCDSRTEMEGFRFWKQGYWKNFLRGLPYHISALYVVDLKQFRAIAAGDRLRQQYHQLSADPNSLSNLDQDLPNNMQMMIPIHSLPQEWLWCETWCSDESLKEARTIDLCNNPMTKEPKLDRARRQVPEWTVYDNEIAELARRTQEGNVLAGEGAGRVQEEEQIEMDRPVKEQEEESRKERVRDEL